MAEVHTGQVTAHHALLTTVVSLAVALLVGAGAVVLYYEVVDSDVVLTPPLAKPVVHVVTPEQVTTARAIDKQEAERAVGAAIAFGGAARTDADAPASSLAGVPARTESMGRIPVDKK
jgi:hypothetical protein